MFERWWTTTSLLAGVLTAHAETLQLRDQASITGKMLAEKRDQVIVDLGFTVLSIPREAILAVTRGDTNAASAQAARAKLTASSVALYSTAEGPLPERSVRELAGELGEAVLQVRTPAGLGSGFFVTEDGYLITNFHVIEGETQISVEVYHQRPTGLERKSYKQVRIVALNKFHDLALLKIEDSAAPKFVKVPLAETEAVAVGQRVFAIGSPLGLERTVTEGIVSTQTREMQGQLYLQTTAQINPGNSGGPLFNLRGEVVGVTNMKIAGSADGRASEGLGFAIPVDLVKYFLKHRDAFAYDNNNPSNAYRYLEPPSRLRQPPSASETE
jgi:serine protease Do